MGDAGCRGDHSDHTLPEKPESCEWAEGGADCGDSRREDVLALELRGSYMNGTTERKMHESIFIHIFMMCRLECRDAHYLGMTLKTAVD